MNYVVAVRALCEFTARRGDLDLRFTPSPSAQEGMAGHLLVASRRPAGYQTEIALEGSHAGLQVRGRADGYDAALNRLEEIKTHRGDVNAVPDNHRCMHWAQAKVYGHLLCCKLSRATMQIALVYFDIGTQQETVLAEQYDASQLQAFFQEQCEHFLHWARQEAAHRSARDHALTALAFPHQDFRSGQRDLAKAVYRAARDGECLMAQAPTGIGKTMGTIFPMLKASPAKLDKVFFLCAKTAGRQLALDAIKRLRHAVPELPLRTLEIVARDQACEHPDKACHGASCPLARGFYDRLPMARQEALQAGVWDETQVRATASAHAVCPYFLAQELARWADVAIGDYNYYFDYNAMLHGLAQANQWRVGVLVDEAHNLVERARGMYTAQLAQADAAALRRRVAKVLRRPLDAINRAWQEMLDTREDGYGVLETPPARLLSALQQGVAAIADYYAGTNSAQASVPAPGSAEDALQQFYFDALRFIRMAEQYGAHSLCDISLPAAGATGAAQDEALAAAQAKALAKAPAKTPAKSYARGPRGKQLAQRQATLCIRNVIPASFLAPRFAAAQSAVLFSATLNPWQFYRDTLGLPAACMCLDVPPPFKPEQLSVHVVRNISTRYRDRAASLAPIVDLMAAQYRRRPGNYLGFSSSFEYSRQLSDLFRDRHPDLQMWEQLPGMSPAQRDGFLARFTPESAGIGFAVLGGAFGEGIDLPGARLIGAFIVTLGLPQMNSVNEQMMHRMEQKFGKGYDYTYLYPGMQKVVQAAGRVIRSESDSGNVYLIDDRYTQAQVRRLLPQWWKIATLSVPTRSAVTPDPGGVAG
jgi:DNA excision repair protein ERCC-2